ncbi:hypothetical protein LCGC14_0736380 [marine sediment metagenome]|uniref:Uncharacterized protein n=1 Tax=marine sediment metagenome TaxID=412755 RepID=A0A0F9Q810_9ZZZZ
MPHPEWTTRVRAHTGQWGNWKEMPTSVDCSVSYVAEWAADHYLKGAAVRPVHGGSIRVEVWHRGAFTHWDVRVQYRRPILTVTRVAVSPA